MDAVLGRGSRVEALYRGEWYIGTIVGLLGSDSDAIGLWSVQFDVDVEGIVTHASRVRDASCTERSSLSSTNASTPILPEQCGTAVGFYGCEQLDDWLPADVSDKFALCLKNGAPLMEDIDQKLLTEAIEYCVHAKRQYMP